LFGRKNSANYSLDLSRSADKYYQKSPPQIKKQFDKKFEILCKYPEAGYPLLGVLAPLWAIESGKFRIEYKIDQLDSKISVVRIGPRGDIYKK
jgi:mRNA-degrading endonuclease RelE of RelBE toxin-antitoxin system